VNSTSFARCIAGTALAAILAGLPVGVAAAQPPSPQDIANNMTATAARGAVRLARNRVLTVSLITPRAISLKRVKV